MTIPSKPDPWVAFRKLRPQARLRLFCFPYAGGGALAYRAWPDEVPPDIEVFPIQLPGRERRLREKPFRRMEHLVDELLRALTPYLDKPFAFFGYSMGAAIAYEITHRLRVENLPQPRHLMVAARRAPQLEPDKDQYYDLPDDEFCDKLREMNGTPQEVLDNRELMELMMPLLRADFELNDTYPVTHHPPFKIPVTAFGGTGDEDVPQERLEAWKEITEGPFGLQMFEGDHFFLHEKRQELVAAVNQCLAES